jgi:chromosome partitioning protein
MGPRDQWFRWYHWSMVTTIGNTKGGVGKTTLAVNLAIGLSRRGEDVLLIDGDKQATALAFTEIRSTRHPEAPSYTAVALQGAQIRTQMRSLERRYEHIVIDAGGQDTESLRAALMVSDLVIIPTAPRSFDLWGVDHTRDLIEQARVVHDLRALAVLNGADANGSDNQSSLDLLAAVAGIEVFPHVIGRRKAFSKAADEGLSVLEYMDANNRPGSLAAREDLNRLLEGAFPKIERMVACL